MNISPHFFHSSFGYRLAYMDWPARGVEKAVVFCVHGLSRNGRDFDWVAKALSECGYRVICPDMAGRGASDIPPDSSFYSYAAYVADCEALLDFLGVKSVHWVGTSMGGLIAMMFAQHAPQRIISLLLNDVGPIVPGAPLERIVRYVTDYPQFTSRVAAEEALKKKISGFGVRDDAHWQHLFRYAFYERADGRFVFSYDPEIVKKLQPNEVIEDVDLWHLWPAITMPTFILRGARSDVLMRETALQMVSLHPNAKLEEIADVGHAPALMDEAQMDLVCEWIKSQE